MKKKKNIYDILITYFEEPTFKKTVLFGLFAGALIVGIPFGLSGIAGLLGGTSALGTLHSLFLPVAFGAVSLVASLGKFYMDTEDKKAKKQKEDIATVSKELEEELVDAKTSTITVQKNTVKNVTVKKQVEDELTKN